MLRSALLCLPLVAAPVGPLAAPVAPATLLAPPAAFGAPCLCFPLRHESGAMVPENALERDGWTAERLSKEALAIASTCDDPFARAEALRRTMLSVQSLGRGATTTSRDFGDALLADLETNLKREAELAPLSRAILAPRGSSGTRAPGLGARGFDAGEPALFGGARCQAAAVRADVAKLDGVKRVELHAAHGGLVIWYDAAVIGTDALVKAAGYACETELRGPDARGHALAAVTLAFAARAADQSGVTEPRIDPSSLAAKAVSLAPKDARILLVAGMVAFDNGDGTTSARYALEAVRNGRGNALVEHNVHHVLGRFYSAASLDELEATLSQRLTAKG